MEVSVSMVEASPVVRISNVATATTDSNLTLLVFCPIYLLQIITFVQVVMAVEYRERMIFDTSHETSVVQLPRYASL